MRRGRALAGARSAGCPAQQDSGCARRCLRVSVTAAPDKGKANQAIVKLLSESLNVAKSSIELRSGATSREKRFLVRGIEQDALLAQIEALVERSG